MAYTEAQKKATLKYKERAYKRIPLDVKIEEYEELKKYVENNREQTTGSINGFIRKLIKENTKKD
jgi:hypothetical protein